MARRPRNPLKQAKVPFRLLAEARSLSFDWLNSLSEEDAYDHFTRVRWRRNGGRPYCPVCGSVRYYPIESRPRWFVCAERGCRKHYSATSGTIFHSRKLSFLKIIEMVFHFTTAVKGVSALQASFATDVSYKTAWVNLHKIRQAMSAEREDIQLQGEIEIDAAFFGGTSKQANMKEDRIDRRLADNQTGKRRALMVVRQRYGKCVAFASRGEDREVVNAAVRVLVPPDVQPDFYTDGEHAYDDLEAFGNSYVVDHSRGFKINGVTNNLAESLFSRARRAEFGSYHHLGQEWLDFYAGELCWRENWRRTGNRQIFTAALAAVADHRVSRVIKGYWQHHLLPDDQLKRQEVRWGPVFRIAYGGWPPPSEILVYADREGHGPRQYDPAWEDKQDFRRARPMRKEPLRLPPPLLRITFVPAA